MRENSDTYFLALHCKSNFILKVRGQSQNKPSIVFSLLMYWACISRAFSFNNRLMWNQLFWFTAWSTICKRHITRLRHWYQTAARQLRSLQVKLQKFQCWHTSMGKIWFVLHYQCIFHQFLVVVISLIHGISRVYGFDIVFCNNINYSCPELQAQFDFFIFLRKALISN